MATSGNRLHPDVPSEWPERFGRAAKVAVVAFVVLQVKELIDAGRFDTLGTGIDAGLIAAATLLLDAVLGMVKGQRKSPGIVPLPRGEAR